MLLNKKQTKPEITQYQKAKILAILDIIQKDKYTEITNIPKHYLQDKDIAEKVKNFHEIQEFETLLEKNKKTLIK